MDDALVFVHLSDIHFNKKLKDSFELDADVRDQLEHDVIRMKAKFKQVTGILIGGDVAYAGKAGDYERAEEWLKKLTSLVGCRPEAVWCVPGNHDVDQGVYEGSRHIQLLHDDLRPKSVDDIDNRLTTVMRDADSATALLKPLQNYNDFASRYRCASRRDPLCWQQDFQLNDGSVLRLHGMNSVLVSYRTDQQRRLIIGSIQCLPREEAGVAYLSICHHPPEWLLDYDVLNQNLNPRARVQLFGHKHFHRAEKIDNCLRIGAGAVHPAREEKKWRPRYNWLQIRVRKEVSARFLDVNVYPRVWADGKPEYMTDGENCDEGKIFKAYFLSLPSWMPPTAKTHVDTSAPPSIGPSPAVIASAGAGVQMDPARTLTFRFLDLSHVKRVEIAQKLSLLKNEDEGLKDFDLLERLFTRAVDNKQLGALWDLVESYHGDNQNPSNPYKGQ